MALLIECTPGRRVRVKTKSWFRTVYYPFGGQSGTVRFTNPKDFFLGQIRVEFDSGQTELVGFDTLDLI